MSDEEKLRTLLRDRMAPGNSGQKTLAGCIADSELVDRDSISRLLDLGCGDGRAHGALKTIIPNLDYHGLDISESPEVGRRTRNDLAFYEFNGIDIPFDESHFDAIYCQQVLEHVRHPDALIAECNRVLIPGGWFFGSVSQLEPYHSRSIFNWTAYGIIEVFESNGFEVKQLVPGIDGITLTLRRLFGTEKFGAFFSVESLFNHFIEHQYIASDKDHFERMYLKLCCAGHIVFIAQKPALAEDV